VEIGEEDRSLEDLLASETGAADVLAEAARALGTESGPSALEARLRSWLVFRSASGIDGEAGDGSRRAWRLVDLLASEAAGGPLRARELARLDASLPPGAVSVRDRFRVHRAYREASGRPGGRAPEAVPTAREVIAAARDPRVRLRVLRESRGRFVRETAGRSLFVCDRTMRDVLVKAGLGGASEALTCREGELLRTLPDRENYRIRVSGYRSGEAVLYMKRYPADRLLDRLLDLVRLRRDVRSRARWEWENLLQLRSIGIATADPVAMAERRRRRRGASVVLTREVEGAVPLDAWVRERYPPAFPARPGTPRLPGTSRKRDVIRGVARLTRTLHRAGAFHKDLYLNHLLVREDAGGLTFHLIDLDRLRWGRRVRSRWFVKDVAALHISADPRIFSRADRLRFLELYLGCRSGEPRLRAFARRVLRKGARMTAHVPRHRPGETEAK
jgi:heptose I phosphotransferase